jgi:RimJ/RimL family protein N-acetyltransferase
LVDWAGTVVATTPRLVLRTFRDEDLPLYAALNADPLVVRYLGGSPLRREYSDDIAAWAQESFARQGFGLLAVERRSDGAFLGMCGLHRHSSHRDEVEVSAGVSPPSTGVAATRRRPRPGGWTTDSTTSPWIT